MVKTGDNKSSRIKVISYGTLGRLIMDRNAGVEEVIAAFQGIICRKELLPVVKKIRY